jgi:hypothetical protein
MLVLEIDAIGAAYTLTETLAEESAVLAGLVTVVEIVNVPGLAAVSVGVMVMALVPALLAEMLPVAPVPPRVQVKVPAWGGTLAVSVAPVVTLVTDVETVAFGGGTIAMVLVPESAIDAWFVTVQDSASEVPLPAVKAMVFAVVLEVMVPPVIVHAKLSPACAGTLADKPVDPAVTDAGAEIEVNGTGYTWIVSVDVAVTPAPFVTVVVRVIGSDVPAVNWILVVPAPPVMVPPVLLHE